MNLVIFPNHEVLILILPYQNKITTNFKIYYFGFNFDRKFTYSHVDFSVKLRYLKYILGPIYLHTTFFKNLT